MAKDKKRTLTFTENEILAFSAVVGNLIMEGELEEDTPEAMLVEAANVFSKFGVISNILAGTATLTREELAGELLSALEDRCLGAEFVVNSKDIIETLFEGGVESVSSEAEVADK